MRCFKTIIIVAMMIASGSNTLVATPAEQWLQQARLAFVQADYAGAVASYEALIADQIVRDARVYANLGTAYHHLGDAGQALWAYRLALRLAPRDARIAADAQFLLGEHLGQMQTSLWQGLIQQGAPWARLLTLGEIATVTAVFYFLLWILATLWLTRRSSAVAKTGIAALVVFIVWTAGVFPKLKQEVCERHAVVMGETVSLYSSFVGGRVITTLKPGEEVRMVKEEAFAATAEGSTREQWAYIETVRDERGWMLRTGLRLLPRWVMDNN